MNKTGVITAGNNPKARDSFVRKCVGLGLIPHIFVCEISNEKMCAINIALWNLEEKCLLSVPLLGLKKKSHCQCCRRG